MASDESIRSTVLEVLSRPEFEPRDDLLSNWMETLSRWLSANEIGLPPWLTWTLFVVLALVLARVLARSLSLGGVSLAPARKRSPASVVEVTGGVAATFEQALALARQALERGDLRQALWIGHRLLLVRLDERGAIRFADGKTNSDYLREAPEHALLGEFTRLYDRVVYGHRPAEPEAVSALLAAVERI